jgi:hypothetical protein
MNQQPVIPAAEIFYRPRLDSLVPTQKINIKRRDGTVPVNNLRYFCGRPICDNCGAENPDSRVHSVQTRDILVRFSTGESCFAQAMDLDLHRALGPRVLSATRTRYDASWPIWAPCLPSFGTSTAACRATARATCASPCTRPQKPAGLA